VIVDPSHGTGRRQWVGPMSKAAVAAGADGLILEVHLDPERALTDGFQTLSCEEFGGLMADVRKIATVVDMKVNTMDEVGPAVSRS